MAPTIVQLEQFVALRDELAYHVQVLVEEEYSSLDMHAKIWGRRYFKVTDTPTDIWLEMMQQWDANITPNWCGDWIVISIDPRQQGRAKRDGYSAAMQSWVSVISLWWKFYGDLSLVDQKGAHELLNAMESAATEMRNGTIAFEWVQKWDRREAGTG